MSILSAPLSNFFCATPCVPMFVSSSSSYSFPCSRFSRNSVGVGLKERARKPRCVCVIYQSKVRATAEVAGAKEASSLVVSSFGEEDKHSRHFLDVRSEEELLFGIWKETEGGGLPPNVAAGMEELYLNYRWAVSRSGDPRADEVVLSNMSVLFDRILLDMEDPFVFSPYHRAKREPFDYYMFGQNYIRPLVDFRNSYVGNIALFYEIEDKLEQGHNIVLISNHQPEADPAIIALLLEKTNRHIAENMTYVAGDRVVTDPLCKPFSMGRNLVCVYSKKHMHDVPELAEMKRRANTRSLKEMDLLLRGGSQIIWIATSGGRDRPDPLSEEWHPWQYILFHTDMRGSGTL